MAFNKDFRIRPFQDTGRGFFHVVMGFFGDLPPVGAIEDPFEPALWFGFLYNLDLFLLEALVPLALPSLLAGEFIVALFAATALGHMANGFQQVAATVCIDDALDIGHAEIVLTFLSIQTGVHVAAFRHALEVSASLAVFAHAVIDTAAGLGLKSSLYASLAVLAKDLYAWFTFGTAASVTEELLLL